MQTRLIRRPEVRRLTGLSDTTIWRKYRAGEFPKPIAIGPNSVAWEERAVLAWIDARIEQSRKA